MTPTHIAELVIIVSVVLAGLNIITQRRLDKEALAKEARREDAAELVRSAIRLEAHTEKVMKARDWICEALKEFRLDDLPLSRDEAYIAEMIIRVGNEAKLRLGDIAGDQN